MVRFGFIERCRYLSVRANASEFAPGLKPLDKTNSLVSRPITCGGERTQLTMHDRQAPQPLGFLGSSLAASCAR